MKIQNCSFTVGKIIQMASVKLCYFEGDSITLPSNKGEGIAHQLKECLTNDLFMEFNKKVGNKIR